MLTQIEDAISDRIQTKMAAVAGMVAVQKGIEGIPQPATYVAAEAGKFEKTGQRSFRQNVTIYIDIIFENLADEYERRKGIYLILEGITQTIMLQDLGLKIKPLEPKSWQNTTIEELREKGLISYSLEVETAFSIEKIDDEAVTNLLTVGFNYFLPGDQVADASDTLTFTP